MKIEVEYIETEDTLYRDIRSDNIKLVIWHRSCPF